MKRCLIIGLTFFSIINGLGQVLVDDFENEFQNWNERYPQLKPYLFFNQNKYAPGDTVYFKAYLFTEGLKLLRDRQILKLSVLNEKGKEVCGENFSVINGTGNNQLILPDSLSGKIYRFIVFNDWMKNFDSKLFFQKDIEIVRDKDIEILHRKKDKSLSFFPEGGKLIANVSNKVVLKYDGFLPGSTGTIMDESKNIITSFTINKDNLSFVIFKPEVGKKYLANIQNEEFFLPMTEKDGISLLVTPKENLQPIKILIAAPSNSLYRKEDLMILIIIRGKIFYNGSLQLSDKPFVQISLPQNNLQPGIALISILDKNKEQIADRLFFINKSEAIEGILSVEKQHILPREKINVNVELRDSIGNPVEGEFAITAVNQKIFEETKEDFFKDELFIKSEFNDPDLLVDRAQTDWFPFLDLRLITQKSIRIKWNEILTRNILPKYEMNTLYHRRGKAFFEDTYEPVPDSTLIIAYLQKNLSSYEVRTKSGLCDFHFLFDIWGEDELFYLGIPPNKYHKRKIRMEWMPDESINLKAPSSVEVNREDRYGNFFSKRREINRSYSYYSQHQSAERYIRDPGEAFEDEMDGADMSFNVEDYIIFPTMEDLVREVVLSLLYRKHGDKQTVRVVLSDSRLAPTEDPLYVIDGLMTKNTELFLSLKPSEILTIKVIKDVKKLSGLGALGSNGIVIVKTKAPNNQRLRENNTILPLTGLSKPISFKRTDYSIQSDLRNPDFRSTLYWNPLIKTDKNGKAMVSFYASDDTGPVQIKLQGLSNSGQPFSKTIKLQVDYSK